MAKPYTVAPTFNSCNKHMKAFGKRAFWKRERQTLGVEDAGVGARKEKVKKVFAIECRAKVGGFLWHHDREWRVWQRYKTLRDAENAYAALNRPSRYWEYRIKE